MVIINANTENSMILPIGRQGEKGVRQVWFDLTYMIDTFGEGTAELHHQRAGDPSPYPCTVQRNGTQLVWKITKIDNAIEGIGKAEIRWLVDGSDDDMAKTVVYKTYTLKSLTGDSEVPDPYESWYEALLEQIGDSQEYAEQADQSARDASQSAQDAETAAGTAAQDAANAVRTELNGLVQQATQSATNASNSADRAEQAAEGVEAASVILSASSQGSGVVTINASISRG